MKSSASRSSSPAPGTTHDGTAAARVAGSAGGRDVLILQGTIGNRAVAETLSSPSGAASGGGSAADPPKDTGIPVRRVLRSPGEPLSSGVRSLMESRLGQDFSDVRVHTSTDAAFSASLLRAEAYTSGEDVVFARDRYAPDTVAGQVLLAHELAHVIQQRGRCAPHRGADRPGLEAVADRSADAVAAGRRPTVAEAADAPAVQLEDEHRFGRGEQTVVVREGRVEVNGQRIPATARGDGVIVHGGREIVLDGDGVFRYRDNRAVARSCNPHYYGADGRRIQGRTLPTKRSGGGRSSEFYDTRTRRNERWRPPTVERRRGAPPAPAIEAPEPDRPLAARRMSEVHRVRTEFEQRVRVAQERGGLTRTQAEERIRARMTAREGDLPGRGEFEAGQTVASTERQVATGVRRLSSTAARQAGTQVPVTQVTSAAVEARVGEINRQLGTNYQAHPRNLRHAEVRQVVQNPNQSAFYPDRPMCGHCQQVFVLESRARGRDLTVVDPDGTQRRFTPDGRIVETSGGTVYERRAALTTQAGRTEVQITGQASVSHSARPQPAATPGRTGPTEPLRRPPSRTATSATTTPSRASRALPTRPAGTPVATPSATLSTSESAAAILKETTPSTSRWAKAARGVWRAAGVALKGLEVSGPIAETLDLVSQFETAKSRLEDIAKQRDQAEVPIMRELGFEPVYRNGIVVDYVKIKPQPTAEGPSSGPSKQTGSVYRLSGLVLQREQVQLSANHMPITFMSLTDEGADIFLLSQPTFRTFSGYATRTDYTRLKELLRLQMGALMLGQRSQRESAPVSTEAAEAPSGDRGRIEIDLYWEEGGTQKGIEARCDNTYSADGSWVATHNGLLEELRTFTEQSGDQPPPEFEMFILYSAADGSDWHKRVVHSAASSHLEEEGQIPAGVLELGKYPEGSAVSFIIENYSY